MNLIAEHNAKYDAGSVTFFLGENAITDMSLVEYNATLLGFAVANTTTTKNYAPSTGKAY